MLLRQTLLFLPAQILPALCQLAALLVWSHLTTPEVIGAVTLFTSVQEFLVLSFLNFWNLYVARYYTKYHEDADELRRLEVTSTGMIGLSIVIQTVIGLLIYWTTIDHHMTPAMALALTGLIAGRTLNLFQAERARARRDILNYTVAVMAGPVFGFFVGLGFVYQFGNSAYWIFMGFALAQIGGVLFGMTRDRHWIKIGRPTAEILREASRYGLPIIVSGLLAWVTLNASRITVGYVYGLGAAGIYSMGLGLGYRASQVAAATVTAASFPMAVRKANAGDLPGARQQVATNGALLFAVLASSLVGLALIASNALDLLLASDMRGPVLPIMLWSLVGGAFICLKQHFLNQFFLIQSETKPIASVAIGEAIFAVVSTTAIVPFAGPTGGGLAFAVTAGAGMAATFLLSRSVGRVVPWGDFARIGLAALLMGAVVLLTPHARTVIGLAGRIAAGGLTFGLALVWLYKPAVSKLLAARRVAARGKQNQGEDRVSDSAEATLRSAGTRTEAPHS